MKINFKKTEQAKRIETSYAMNAIDLSFTPVRKTEGSVGYDLFCCIEHEIAIFPGEFEKVGTGVCLDIGNNEMIKSWKEYDGIIETIGGFLFPRSSITGLMLTNGVGVCDDDYQGEYIAKLFNYSEDVKYINPGDRLIQLLFIPVILPNLQEVEEFENETLRGSGAFGSTGR